MTSLAEIATDQSLQPSAASRLHSFSGTSFAGVAMAQQWVDLIVWEGILNDNPHVNGVVEIGTFKGGFSLYLAAQCQAREIFFRTYDVFPPEVKVPGFVKLDVFAHAEEVGGHLKRHDPVILFCDGGNKGRELRTFSKYLSPFSLIVAHDWGTELFASDIPDNVDYVYESWLQDLGSPSRIFRVKSAD